MGFGNFTLDGKTFTQSGGAVYGHECYVYYSNFINNSAFSGGAVDFTYIEVYDSTFKDNEAIYGGAIASAAECYIEYSNFTANKASRGGAVYCNDSNLTVGAGIFSNNIANASTTRTPEGGAFKKSMVILEPIASTHPTWRMPFTSADQDNGPGLGVRVREIVKDTTQGRMVYDPTNPLADENGYVTFESPAVTDVLFTNRPHEEYKGKTPIKLYYHTTIRKKFHTPSKNTIDGKWQPWNPTLKMVLKEKINLFQGLCVQF